jgi:hypothetical protein
MLIKLTVERSAQRMWTIKWGAEIYLSLVNYSRNDNIHYITIIKISITVRAQKQYF